MADSVLATEALTKRYGAKRGIEEVSLQVRRGEVFGFLGPNGAGKTTTIRTVLDIIRPTSGRARLFGLDARADREAIHARVGYLPGELGLADRMTVEQQLRHHASLRGGVPWARIEGLARRFDLELARPVRALSRGNRQKVGIVQAFMHEPELLILDEPTGGLDPLMQQEFNELLRERVAAGATVFLSSHILPEVEALCDRVGIIREGRLAAVEDVEALKHRAVRLVRAEFAAPPDPAWAEGVAGVRAVRVEGRALLVEAQGEVGALVRALAGHPLVDLHTEETTLESIFLGFYGKEEAE